MMVRMAAVAAAEARSSACAEEDGLGETDRRKQRGGIGRVRFGGAKARASFRVWKGPRAG